MAEWAKLFAVAALVGVVGFLTTFVVLFEPQTISATVASPGAVRPVVPSVVKTAELPVSAATKPVAKTIPSSSRTPVPAVVTTVVPTKEITVIEKFETESEVGTSPAREVIPDEVKNPGKYLPENPPQPPAPVIDDEPADEAPVAE